MLGVYVDKLFAQGFQLSHRNRGIVDKGPRLARRENLAPQDALAFVVVEFVLVEEVAQMIRRNVEHPLDYGLLVAVPQRFQVGPLTEYQ